MKQRIERKIIFLGIVGAIFFCFPLFAFADSLGQKVYFYVDPSYDLSGRTRVNASLEKISDNIYFYIEDEWFHSLEEDERDEVNQNLETVAQEFSKNIYPSLVSFFGSEWKPGIDNDYRITFLFHQIKGGGGGYFNSADEYPTAQAPTSNVREMFYLNTQYLSSPILKSLVAHELIHLITFNQKERLEGVKEEVWLNEARAEYAPTLAGYDDVYQGSNLQNRVNRFLSFPSDSLTEWQNQERDYGAINLFVHYLVDYYGIEILVDSMRSSKVGIPSINDALEKNVFQEDFSQIFTDWTITAFLNNCQFGEKYCYKNENLKNIKITPSLIFLPPTQKAEFSLNYAVSQWSGNWYRIIGGEGDLTVNFSGFPTVQFKVPYITCEDSQNCFVNYLTLNESQNGEIILQDFGKNVTSLILIPSVQSKTVGFDGMEPLYSFSISASLQTESQQNSLIEELLVQIDFLQKEIARIQAQINKILTGGGEDFSCQKFENNLYYGLTNNLEVSCLQDFLKSQGSEIYPEGLVTGNFLSLTQNAVIRFQEKYAPEILTPLNLEKGTGFVGSMTKNKINQILGK